MQFLPTSIAGVAEVTIELNTDERGAFGRVYCRREFAQNALPFELDQCSLSSNTQRGTVRGFHLQSEPHQEAKLVHCVSGRLFDVALDLRSGSSTYGHHHALELSAENDRMLYIPEGCAHAFQTLEDATTIIYYISSFYEPASARGVRWDDPEIGVQWPLPQAAIVSPRDRGLPLLADYRA